MDVSGDEPRCVVEEKPVGELTADEKKWLNEPQWTYRLHAVVKDGSVTVEREEPRASGRPS